MAKKNILKNKTFLMFITILFVFILGLYFTYGNISSRRNTKYINKPNLEDKMQNTYDNSEKNNLITEAGNTFNGVNLINDNRGVPVLYYHSVRESVDNEVIISPKMLRNELQYLKDQGYTTLTMSELNNYLLNSSPIPEKSIVITFDDGYMDNYQNAFPILKELNMKATIFCITFKLDGEYYLSKDAIKEMSDYGIDIQSHTVNHSKLNKLTYDKQLSELKTSKETLESITGKPVFAIAYPYGEYNTDSVKAAKNAGYNLAFTTNRGLSDRDDNPLELNRIYISSKYNMETFKQILANTKK